jgi:hypothetical protein
MEVVHKTRSELHRPRMVVITGGPGAGKTALIEVARRHFCHHVGFSPEAASILFRGGFPPRRGLTRAPAVHPACHFSRAVRAGADRGGGSGL